MFKNNNDLFMIMRTFNVVVEKGEDGYFISEVIGLPGCHTQAKNLDQLMERTKEAIRVYLGAKKQEEPTLQFVGLQQVEVEA